MNRRGVCYDVGRVLGINWRPEFDPAVVRRELEIIATDLHCTAVRICGRDTDRLVRAAEDALALGLEVWFSPELWDRGPRRTLAHIVAAARRAERLRRRCPERLVFSVATESTLFMRGIVPGRTFNRRVTNLFDTVRAERHAAPLRAFLASAVREVRGVYAGPLSYASLPFEPVDWELFDIVGVDHYRDSRSEARYLDTLRRLAGHGKPVVVTEFGMRTYRGADTDGNTGTGIADGRSIALHRIPLAGRFVRPRLVPGDHVRDEDLQARRITEDLTIMDAAGVDGAFVCTFAEPMSPYSPDPRYDLDMSALSLVRWYEDGHGTTYPDMRWEPKRSFFAVAGYFAGRAAEPPAPG